jgi:hypothetical protein
MAKRRAGSQTANLTSDQKKSGIDPISLSADGVRHIVESSQQGLQIFFRLHLDPRFARKVMGFQSRRRSPNLGDFGTPTWEFRDKKPFGCGPVKRCKVYYKGEGGGFPQVQVVVSFVCPCCPWFVLAPKVLQLRTNHLMWVLCRPV